MNEKVEFFHKKIKYANAPYEELIGYLCDYKLISTNINCGGYCNPIKRVIAYNNGGLKTILHELSHAYQAELELLDNRELIISKEISIEQQCETMAYYLYSSINKKHVNSNVFKSYFNMDDLKFLIEWYGGLVQNDLLV